MIVFHRQQPPREYSQTGTNPASETDWGHFDNRDYSDEEIYSSSNRDSDSMDLKETANGDKRGIWRERSERITHQQWGFFTSDSMI